MVAVDAFVWLCCSLRANANGPDLPPSPASSPQDLQKQILTSLLALNDTGSIHTWIPVLDYHQLHLMHIETGYLINNGTQ